MISLLLVSCAQLCSVHLYEVGFSHPKRGYCYCAESVKVDAPQPMELNLRWNRSVPHEDREAIQVTPSFPKFDLSEPVDSDE